MPAALTAAQFVTELTSLSSADEIPRVARFFCPDPHGCSDDNEILGVSIGKVFPVAKKFDRMPPDEVEKLLENRFYEARMGAVSIMDFQARAKSTTSARREALYHLYLRRHDRINNWDLVDRAAPHVIGQHLADRPRDILYQLAASRNPWERRTAIVSTWYFIKAGDTADTFALAGRLLHDPHDLVQKAVGSWIREAGKKDPATLRALLEKHAVDMPRVTLRLAVEKFDPAEKKRFLGMARGQ